MRWCEERVGAWLVEASPFSESRPQEIRPGVASLVGWSEEACTTPAWPNRRGASLLWGLFFLFFLKNYPGGFVFSVPPPPQSPLFIIFFFSFSFFFEVWGICQNLFHACPLGAGSTLMMGGHTAAGGKTARPTGTASAPGPRGRASTPVPGATASRWWVSTPGLVETPTRAPGHRASAMALEWKTRASGSTRASGHMDLRDAMAYVRALRAAPSMRAPGTTDCRMDTAPRPTLTEVRAEPYPEACSCVTWNRATEPEFRFEPKRK